MRIFRVGGRCTQHSRKLTKGMGTAWALAKGGTGDGLKGSSRGCQLGFNRRVPSPTVRLFTFNNLRFREVV
jgi:hypothetical protein